ncbi:MAG: hypothetical protein AB9858_02075 [Acidaminococcaceae bacterium]
MAEDIKKEQREMGEEEFLEVVASVREKIKNSSELKQDGKSTTLEVIDAIIRSVEAHGVKQHGLTKKKKKIALTVFEKMGKAEDNTEEEKAVFNALVFITFQGITQAK